MNDLPPPARAIRPLPSELADQIAAGEVVERPASAVKELVENALDAGATRLTVEIEHGGQALIRVTDNGAGIAADELPLAVTRHATSKIATFHDLLRVNSFGFRGEALASIGSVSLLRMVSRVGHAEAAAIAVEHGRIGPLAPAALGQGTVVEVRDLFAAVPARLKFLKSEATEARRCQEAVERMALARLDAGFVFKNGGRTVFRFAPDQPLQGRLAALWPPAVCEGMLSFDRSRDSMRVHGLAGSPQKAQGRADRMLFYVNGRAVQDRVLASAAREAYKGRLLAREYPQVVAFIELPAEEVDVNVHPAKAEVRFRDEQAVFRLVRQTLLDALEATGPALYADAGRSPGEASTAADAVAGWRPRTPTELGIAGQRSLPVSPRFPAYAEYLRDAESHDAAEGEAAAPHPDAPAQAQRGPVIHEPPVPPPPSPRPAVVAAPADAPQLSAGPRYLGQIADTYLLLELPDGTLGILDQHAAHERVLYAAMRSRGRSGQSQPLALPLDLSLHPAQAARLDELREELAALGFALAREGQRLRVTAVPPSLSAGEAREYLEAALSGQNASLEELWVLMSCKTALKAGVPLARDEALRLLEAWLAAPDRSYCPHGRPALVRLGPAELERLFKRR